MNGKDVFSVVGRFVRKASGKVGVPPGLAEHSEVSELKRSSVSLFRYNQLEYSEAREIDIELALSERIDNDVLWINIDGNEDISAVQKVGDKLGIHTLILEDIVSSSQRPRVDITDDYVFIVLRMLSYDNENDIVNSEQLSLILTDNCVVSFQERAGDVFDHLRTRIRTAKGRVRCMSAGYLAYCILDAIVDNYFVVLERLGEQFDDLDDELLDDPLPETQRKIHDIKREIIYLKKSVWPLRDMLSTLMREESRHIQSQVKTFIRDLYEHTIQVIDTVETLRDISSGMMDLYMSCLSNKMNEVMKTLTIIATIFIPITFIAGIYGMNFEFMPELHWKYGYFALWSVLLLIVAVMIVFFKKKRWL